MNDNLIPQVISKTGRFEFVTKKSPDIRYLATIRGNFIKGELRQWTLVSLDCSVTDDQLEAVIDLIETKKSHIKWDSTLTEVNKDGQLLS